MTTLDLTLTYVKSNREQPCGVCGAQFVPSEDTGSRVLSIKAQAQEPLGALMCGGCYSRWSHGTTVTIRGRVAG
jgi:hypothetical protein